jgi:hypothetical protein
MQDHPTAQEIIDAVAQFLNTELAPTLNDPRQKFRALVAANVLQIVAREMELGDALMRAEWHRLNALMGDDAPGENYAQEVDVMNRALCVRIRAGEVDGGKIHQDIVAHVKQTVMEKLQVANPKYLERMLKETAKLRDSAQIK